MTDFCMVVGTTSPARALTLQDGTGAPVNLEGAAVAVRIEGLDVPYTADRPLVVTDAAAGAVQFDPIAADTAAPGLYRLEIAVTYADNAVEVFPVEGPIWMDVRP